MEVTTDQKIKEITLNASGVVLKYVVPCVTLV